MLTSPLAILIESSYAIELLHLPACTSSSCTIVPFPAMFSKTPGPIESDASAQVYVFNQRGDTFTYNMLRDASAIEVHESARVRLYDLCGGTVACSAPQEPVAVEIAGHAYLRLLNLWSGTIACSVVRKLFPGHTSMTQLRAARPLQPHSNL